MRTPFSSSIHDELIPSPGLLRPGSFVSFCSIFHFSQSASVQKTTRGCAAFERGAGITRWCGSLAYRSSRPDFGGLVGIVTAAGALMADVCLGTTVGNNHNIFEHQTHLSSVNCWSRLAICLCRSWLLRSTCERNGSCQGGPQRSPEIQSTLVWSSCWGATGSAGRSTQRGEQRRVVRTRGNKGEVGVTRDQCRVW